MIKTFLLSLIMATSLKVLAESIETIPARGELKSEVRIEMYGDYQCPFSNRGNKIIDELLSDIKNDVSVTFRHFPLEFHTMARYAHKSSICSLAQGKFWEMHDALFKLNSKNFTSQNIDKLAKKIELDQDLYKKCMESKEADAIIERDLKEASNLKINGAPTFIISGPKGTKVLPGAYPLEELKQAIQSVQY